MMGIYIKDMDMPKENAICVMIYPDGIVTSQYGTFHLRDGRVISQYDTFYLGTAVPVPPHGDLIDRKTLLADTTDMIHSMMIFGGARVYTSDAIKNAPTIIPADKEEA